MVTHTSCTYMKSTYQLKKPTKREQIKIAQTIDAAQMSYSRGLTTHAQYKTHNPELSQDLVQVTFLKTLLYLQKGGQITTMRNFLNHILNGLIIDEYRKRKVTSLDLLLEQGFEIGVHEAERTANIFDGKLVVLLIELLPVKYQPIIRMRYLQDLSLKEISLLTGLSTNTIAVQSHRGLSKLKTLYLASQR